MPIYEYICSTCGDEFEEIQRVHDAPLRRHSCSVTSKVKRKMSLSAFQLKGGGWYNEGYSAPANGNGKKTADTKEASPADATPKKESAGDAETKTAAKPAEKTKKAGTSGTSASA